MLEIHLINKPLLRQTKSFGFCSKESTVLFLLAQHKSWSLLHNLSAIVIWW